MNQDQFLSWLRTTLGGIGALAVQYGLTNSNTATWITGALVAIAPFVWGYFVHTDSAKLAAVEALPGVEKIVTAPNAADGVAAATADRSRPKVVAEFPSPSPYATSSQRK